MDGDDGASRQAILAGGWVPASFTRGTGERRGGRLAGMVGKAGRCLLLIDLAARSFAFAVPSCQATSKLGSFPTIQASSGSHATIQTNDFLSLI